MTSRMPCAFGVMLLAGLAGCAGMTGKRIEVRAEGTPYQGLTATSYGPLTTGPLRVCDPARAARAAGGGAAAANEAKINDFSQSIAASITSVVGMPLQGLTKIDSTLVTLQLDEHIAVPSDTNHPTVAVLAYDAQGILFWHAANVVRLQELAAAAGAYCIRQGGTAAVHVGSASRCAPVETGPRSFQIYPVHALASFRCSR